MESAEDSIPAARRNKSTERTSVAGGGRAELGAARPSPAQRAITRVHCRSETCALHVSKANLGRTSPPPAVSFVLPHSRLSLNTAQRERRHACLQDTEFLTGLRPGCRVAWQTLVPCSQPGRGRPLACWRSYCHQRETPHPLFCIIMSGQG